MNGKSAGQTACIAWNAAFGEQFGVIAADEWELGDPRGRAAWEAAAAAVETEQIREIRADRDQLKKHMLDLAAAWKDEAADDLARVRPAPGGSTRAGVLNQCAGQICKGLDA